MRHTKITAPHRTDHGLTLLELLIVVISLATFASVGVQIFSSVQRSAREAKLHADVHILNGAVRHYLATGGQMADLKCVDSVLRKLKQTHSEADRRVFAGAGTGSVVDHRLTAQRWPTNAMSQNDPRAVWCTINYRFEVTRSPGDGVREFYLDHDLADSAPEMDTTRSGSTLGFARTSSWVWDYSDAPAMVQQGPTVIPTVAAAAPWAGPTNVAVSTSGGSTDPSGGYGDVVGGIALNVGGGSTTSTGGIALGVLSEQTSAQQGQIAVGVLGIQITLGPNSQPVSVSNPAVPIAQETSSGGTLNLGSGAAAANEGLGVNAGSGSASAIEGIAANAGSGEANTVNGIVANAGSGEANAIQGIAGNIGSGSSTATNGLGLNLGGGSATAGGITSP